MPIDRKSAHYYIDKLEELIYEGPCPHRERLAGQLMNMDGDILLEALVMMAQVKAKGGKKAVRELFELVLEANPSWEMRNDPSNN